jgi:hypothetical protein
MGALFWYSRVVPAVQICAVFSCTYVASFVPSGFHGALKASAVVTVLHSSGSNGGGAGTSSGFSLSSRFSRTTCLSCSVDFALRMSAAVSTSKLELSAFASSSKYCNPL